VQPHCRPWFLARYTDFRYKYAYARNRCTYRNAGRPATYVLHAGEFPYCIARRFNVDPSDLLNLNGLSSGEVLQPGMTLSIPATGSFPGDRALQAHPTQYTVAVNDTFYTIACAFGDVDPNTIAAANGLAVTARLHRAILNIP